MKLMFASDIHGSYKYARLVKERYEEEKAERLILLGDLLYHGPRNDLPEEYAPKKVIELLNSLSSQVLCVRGNCEAEVDQMVLDFPVMAEYAILFEKGRLFFLTHGHIYNKENMPKLKRGDVLIHGHTHIQAMESTKEGVIYINPGSVAIPKNGNCHSYMMYEAGVFTIKNIEDKKIVERLSLDEQ
ncbi:MAG: phosphodiesterase [Firmicutes bacterium]|nr:phosphodiesterase [Bacillota bacterium]